MWFSAPGIKFLLEGGVIILSWVCYVILFRVYWVEIVMLFSFRGIQFLLEGGLIMLSWVCYVIFFRGIKFLLEGGMITELRLLCDSILVVLNFYWKEGWLLSWACYVILCSRYSISIGKRGDYSTSHITSSTEYNHPSFQLNTWSRESHTVLHCSTAFRPLNSGCTKWSWCIMWRKVVLQCSSEDDSSSMQHCFSWPLKSGLILFRGIKLNWKEGWLL